MSKTIREVVNALLTACEYMHETEHMIRLCQELEYRTMCIGCAWTDDGNKIFSVLVLLYGSYGINPESGWIEGLSERHDIMAAIRTYKEGLGKEENA